MGRERKGREGRDGGDRGEGSGLVCFISLRGIHLWGYR